MAGIEKTLNDAAFGFKSSIIASEFREALDRTGGNAGAVTATTVAIRARHKNNGWRREG